MNYYKRHLGDYARKAGHLSMLEHGAYNLILDAYYDREVAPTRAEAIRYARARSPDEVAAVDVVLAEFFTERDGRFYQARVEHEFDVAAEQADRNKANGMRGGRPRKAAPSTSAKPKKTQSVSSGFQKESETKGNPLIHQSNSVPNGTGADAPPDPIWGTGLAFLKRKGVPEAQARSFLGKLRKQAGDVEISAALADAEAQDISDPIPWLSRAAVNARAGPAASKTMGAIQRLEGMKNGLAENRNSDRVPEAALPRLGSDPRD